jgi:hypothetical protein
MPRLRALAPWSLAALALAWAVAEASPEEIDRLNIREATFLAMTRAIAALATRLESLEAFTTPPHVDTLPVLPSAFDDTMDDDGMFSGAHEAEFESASMFEAEIDAAPAARQASAIDVRTAEAVMCVLIYLSSDWALTDRNGLTLAESHRFALG